MVYLLTFFDPPVFINSLFSPQVLIDTPPPNLMFLSNSSNQYQPIWKPLFYNLDNTENYLKNIFVIWYLVKNDINPFIIIIFSCLKDFFLHVKYIHILDSKKRKFVIFLMSKEENYLHWKWLYWFHTMDLKAEISVKNPKLIEFKIN